MKTQVAHLPHRSLRYLESGAGRVVLLAHAFPLSADQWLPQLHRVSPGWRFIAPDLRGFRGAGPAFEDAGLSGLTMDDYADDLAALLAHLEIERAVVAGVSMGGYVAFALRRRAPARVAGIVLSNTRATPDTPEGRAARDRLIALVEHDGVTALAAEMVPRLLGDTTRREQPDLEEAVRRLVGMNRAEGLAAALAALRDRPDSTPDLATLDVPVRIVAGDEDVVTPVAEAERIYHAIRGSSLVVLPRVGHLSNLEAPLAWTRALDEWLATL